ncbi:MAG: hypothetical protein PHV20_03810 [Bacteroidales bacterium]|nr:hypothetical protein [Bacteroidales bacterium]
MNQQAAKSTPKARSVELPMNATYWGRNWGVLVMMDAHNKEVLYCKFIGKERFSNHKNEIEYLEQ